MSFYPNEPIEQALAKWEREQERLDHIQPKCDKCGEPLGEDYWEIEPWQRWCEDCVEEWLDDRKHETPERE